LTLPRPTVPYPALDPIAAIRGFARTRSQETLEAWPKSPREQGLSTLLSGTDEEVLVMLGKRSGLNGSDHPYLDHVGRDSFYGFLALHQGELFRDEHFADLYCSDNGRPSVPPSLLATALLLQVHDGVSDEEAKSRADFDLRWKVALGIGLEERPFAKSTLQLFRAHLIIHERVRAVFQKSLDFARQTGYFQSRKKLKIVLDTSYILGRGSVKDTYNLLWAMGSGSSCGRWLPLPLRSPSSGQVSTASNATLALASRGRQASTGTTPRREKHSSKAWLQMRIACSW